MDNNEFIKEFHEDVKVAASISGEGKCATFIEHFTRYLIDSEVLSDFNPSFYIGKNVRSNYRVDGYVYDEFDKAMTLLIADYDGVDLNRKLTNTIATRDFGLLSVFLKTALTTNLYKEIEMSTPCADLVDLLRSNEKTIRQFRFIIVTDATISESIKMINIPDYNGIPIEGQLWDLDRVYRVCCSESGKQQIEINFKDYCDNGIPCLEASSASFDQYSSYLGVIPGKVLADIYDKYGSRLLEGNVRSFLSTKVAVNKKIRSTILTEPKMFLAYNNGISATAMDVEIETTNKGKFITFARDFQIINGGQTTASISSARYKDKADLNGIFVQMKLTQLDGSSPDETDELIRNISRSSNSQNKVSDADFFASHAFHRRMEQISRRLFAPAVGGTMFETKWFYERARGQYLQEQMKLTSSEKKKYIAQNPKSQVIKKTDLAKVQNTWRGYPHIVSKGAQTNFMDFAEHIDSEWDKNKDQFNEMYYKETVALMILFQYLEKTIPKQSWYEGGYRANIICYAIAQFRRLIKEQYNNSDLDLMIIWNKQKVPELIGGALIQLSELVLQELTSSSRPVANVTQWCKREGCWNSVKKIKLVLPSEIEDYLVDKMEQSHMKAGAKKDQKEVDGIEAQTIVCNYGSDFWMELKDFAMKKKLVYSESELRALSVACNLSAKSVPDPNQSKKLLALFEKAKIEGFKK